jgi:hypothetical protein
LAARGDEYVTSVIRRRLFITPRQLLRFSFEILIDREPIVAGSQYCRTLLKILLQLRSLSFSNWQPA